MITKDSSIKVNTKLFVLDTSVVLYDHDAFQNFHEHDVAIPIQVLEELDNHKSGNETRNYEASSFIRLMDEISKNKLINEWVQLKGKGRGKFKVVMEDIPAKVNAEKVFGEGKFDHRILNAALSLREKYPGKKVVLVSKDICLRLKAKALNLFSEDYETGKVKNVEELYTGKTEIDKVNQKLLQELVVQGPVSVNNDELSLPDNSSFLILRNKRKSVPAYFDKNNQLEICPLDTATFRIINGLKDTTLDTIMSGETLNYAFMVGDPNPSPPYLKTLQVIGNSISGRTASFTKQAVVTGIRNKLSTFTTSLPTRPSMILRDPPGDGSYSFIEKGQKICKTLEFKKENAGGIAVDHEIKLGQTTTIAVGAGVLTINSAGAILDENLGYTYTRTVVDQNAVQTCIAFDERISTSESDLIVGPQADLFIGEGSNVIVGFADEVSVDPMSCIASSNIITLGGPGEFSTGFIYSRFQIQNYVIPFLQRAFEAETDSVRKNNFLLSIEDWNQNLLLNDSLVFNSG